MKKNDSGLKQQPRFRPLSRPQRAASWQTIAELFPKLPFTANMDALFEAIARVWPLNARHRRSLPADIRALSSILTSERGQLRSSYWNRPAFVSAYLYYFLPWNIIRLGRLCAGLDLPKPELKNSLAPCLLDAGSGPLTLPMALWLARPQWRGLPVQIAALDTARQPLLLGSRIFAALGEILGQPAWRVIPATGPLRGLGKNLPANAWPWLLTCANTLNELKIRPSQQVEDEEEDGFEDAAEEYFSSLIEAWEPLLRTAPLLLVEPGTRLGGGIIARFRQAALELGYFPQAPCVHAQPCPLLGGSAWCHFVFSAQDAPEQLKSLAREARLFKTSLSLSMLLLAKARPATPKQGLPTRVISQSFEAQGKICRYACSSRGLCLLPDSARLVSGSLTLAREPNPTLIDQKSGAAILAPNLAASTGRRN